LNEQHKACKQTDMGFIISAEILKPRLKNYPQDSLPCQDFPYMFFCQNNQGLQESGKNIVGLMSPPKLSGKV